MEHPFFDFLSSSLIPELRADVAAGSSCNVKLGLVVVMAFRTFPNKLSVLFNYADFAVVAALLTVIAFCVELCVHNVFIDEFNNLKNGRNIVLHIGYFNVADCAAR